MHDAQTPRKPEIRAAGQAAGEAAGLLFRAMLYPTLYSWFVLVASLDIMLTWVILHLGGQELNALADWVIREHGLAGMVAYKFVLVLFVIGVCEAVGRRNHDTGATLTRWAILITLFPVLVGLMHLSRAILVGPGEALTVAL